MIYNAINTFDLLNDACIRYTSVMSDTLGITYGTMCIVYPHSAAMDCDADMLVSVADDFRL